MNKKLSNFKSSAGKLASKAGNGFRVALKATRPFVGVAAQLGTYWKGAGYIGAGLSALSAGVDVVDHFATSRSLSHFSDGRYRLSPSLTNTLRRVATISSVRHKIDHGGVVIEATAFGFPIYLIADKGSDRYRYDEDDTPPSTSVSYNSYALVRCEDYESLLNKLRDFAWEDAGSDHLLVSMRDNNSNNDGVKRLDMILDDREYTDFCREVEQRVTPFIRKKRRGLLLNGLPGTGKSTAAQLVGRQLGARSLTIEFSTSGNAMTRAYEAIAAYQPEIVILDDIDRLSEEVQANLLSWIERIQNVIIIATSNRLSDIDIALRRPGRFDEVIESRAYSDREIKARFPEGLDDQLLTELRRWPAAFVEELRQRTTVGHPRERAISELQARVNELYEEYKIG